MLTVSSSAPTPSPARTSANSDSSRSSGFFGFSPSVVKNGSDLWERSSGWVISVRGSDALNARMSDVFISNLLNYGRSAHGGLRERPQRRRVRQVVLPPAGRVALRPRGGARRQQPLAQLACARRPILRLFFEALHDEAFEVR